MRWPSLLAAPSSTAGVLALIALAAPAPASAKVIELGSGPGLTPITTPACPPGVKPTKCTIVLTQVTALEVARNGITFPTKVTKRGRIVAFTLGLSNLTSNKQDREKDIGYLDSTYGGQPLAAITVLSPNGSAGQNRWTVAAESGDFRLISYLGEVAQFPLEKSLLVEPGDVVALTVPSWAPVLSIHLRPQSEFEYRQSRIFNCANPPSSTQAQVNVGTTTTYGCDYTGTRIEYSATEVTSPRPTS